MHASDKIQTSDESIEEMEKGSGHKRGIYRHYLNMQR